MNINLLTIDQPSGPKASNAPRGRDSSNSVGGSNGSFQIAYARVLSDSDAPTAHASRGQHKLPPPREAAHTVRAGETLYGIVRAHLAAMGVDANAKALMHGVMQLAQANHISNPDRIYVGQKLDLAPLASPFGQPAALAEGSIDKPPTSDTAIEQLQQWHWEASLPQADAQITAKVAAALQPTFDALPPTLARDDAADAAMVDAGARTPLALRQVALYDQEASIGAARPAEAVRALPDIIYKGVVGKVLDAMPLEPSARTGLQQASAVVGSAASAHALGVLTGFGGPLLTVAGLIWGIFSARQIHAAATADSNTITASAPAGDPQLASTGMQLAQNDRIEERN